MGVSGIYQFTVRDLIKTSGLEEWIEKSSIYAELDAAYAEREGRHNIPNEMTGVFEGRTLYILCSSL